MKRYAALIAGYGVQGTTLSVCLRDSGLLQPEQMLIVDRYADPLTVIRERFGDCRTRILRSGMSDSVSGDPNSLLQFAEQTQRRASDCDETWHRPTARLFVDHARAVAEALHLGDSLHIGLITAIAREGDGTLRVTTSTGVFQADRVYRAMGMDAPDMPEWASRYQGHDLRISHVFDRDYEVEHLPEGQQCAVFGGGITSVQVARSERFELLRSDGDRGTIPPWEREWLRAAIASGDVEHRVAKVAHLDPKQNAVDVILVDGTVIPVSLVVLATGLRKQLHDWLMDSAQDLKLPLYGGHPVLTNELEWGEGTGVFVLGHHASPVLGPYAGNIMGGRVGAAILRDRLVRELGQ